MWPVLSLNGCGVVGDELVMPCRNPPNGLLRKRTHPGACPGTVRALRPGSGAEMTLPVMTRDELAATPPERRFYVCTGCRCRGTDPGLFRMVNVGLLGFVMCKNCLKGENE